MQRAEAEAPPIREDANTSEYEDKSEGVAESDVDVEVEEVEIHGRMYYATDTLDGVIYDVDDEGDPADECGHYADGVPMLVVPHFA